MPFQNPALNAAELSPAGRKRLEQASRSAPSMRFGEGNAEAVRTIQQLLISLSDPACAIPAGATGTFGAQTLQAVKGFQKQRGLVVDGIVGRQTMEAMDRLSPGTDMSAEIEQCHKEIKHLAFKLSMAPGGIKFSRMVTQAHRLATARGAPGDPQLVGAVVAVPVIVVLLLLVAILALVFLQAQAAMKRDLAVVRALQKAIEERLVRLGQIIRTLEAQAITALATTVVEISKAITQINDWVTECENKADPEKLKKCRDKYEAMNRAIKQLKYLLDNLRKDPGYLTPQSIESLMAKAVVRLDEYRVAAVDLARCLGCA